jgi:hypothetical protein
MLDLDGLKELYQRHQDDAVLSAYLDANQHDFGNRAKWRIVLANALRDASRNVPDDQREAFTAAAKHLESRLAEHGNGFLPGRGWVGFATEHGVIRAEGVPVPMPDLVRWERGLRVAPYVRALRQARPVIGVIVDSRQARVVRYAAGELTERDHLHGDTALGDLTDIVQSKRAAVATGVRGKTGTDTAQTLLRVERDRLLGRVAEEVLEAAGASGGVVLGGTAQATAALRNLLEEHLDAGRLFEHDGLALDLTDAEIRSLLEQAASDLTDRRNARLVEQLLDEARGGQAGCLGEDDVVQALREHRVRLLAFTDGFRAAHPDRTDHLTGAAFMQGAELEEIGREPGARLDAAGGVGALLHYRIRNTG